MRVVEINSIDRLPGLRLAWKSLLGETPGAGFHQSCEWLEAVCRHQEQPAARLRVLLVTGGGETVGILPLVQVEHATPGGTVRVLGYPRDPWSPCHGPIGPQPTATLMAGLRYLASDVQDWDVLELRDVNRAAAVYQRTRTALEVAAMSFRETDEPLCQVFDLPPQRREGAAGIGPARGRVVPARELTFHRHRVRGAMYDDANPNWSVFDQCLELTAERDRRSDRTTRLLREIHAAASRAGAADINTLRHGGQLVACCYNVHFGGTLLTVFGGEQGEMPLLLEKMLEDSVTRDDQRWVPGALGRCPTWQSTPLPRARFRHDRRRGVRRMLGRIADWLPVSSGCQ